MPLILEACPSFQTFWGEEQLASGAEDYVLYVGFGAFAAHLQSLQRRDELCEFPAVDSTISRLRDEGDDEVQKLAKDLRQSIDSALSE